MRCLFPHISFRLPVLALFLGTALLVEDAKADPSFDVRAKTKDKITATLYVSNVFVLGKARQGSFGAPSINDKGAIAYACILSGSGLSSLSSNSVVVRLKGKKPAHVAIQADNIVDDSFLPPVPGAPSAVSQTGRMYRIGRDVAINNKNRVAFAGQLLYTKSSGGIDPTFSTADTSVYGELTPATKKATAFYNFGLSRYLDFSEDIFTRTISLNTQGSIAYDAEFGITSDQFVPGFAYSNPANYFTFDDGSRSPSPVVIATTESPVIGLPYFTTFQSFSPSIIADHNVAFVVADISDTGDSFDGIWQGDNPDLQPVTVKNTAAPGGGKYATFGEKIGPSRNGKMCAFTATLSGSVSAGVFRVNKDGSKGVRIAAVGDAAPDNALSGNLGNFTAFDLAVTNNSGQVAFQGSVAGTTTDRSGIWLSDRNGSSLSLIVVEGQTIRVGSVSKKITKIAFSPISGLNSKGQVAFTASFTDRTSAVIVAQL